MLDGDAVRRELAKLSAQIGAIDAELADVARTDPVAGLIADRQRVQERWDACTPAIQGQIIDLLVTVTVLPIPRGTKAPGVFNPDFVRVEWKR